MKREKHVFAALGVLFAAAMACAAPAGAQGFYVGGSIGQMKAKDACSGISGAGVSCDDKDTAWRILGGYQVNRNFGAEVGYHDFGKAKASFPGGSAEIKAAAYLRMFQNGNQLHWKIGSGGPEYDYSQDPIYQDQMRASYLWLKNNWFDGLEFHRLPAVGAEIEQVGLQCGPGQC